MELTLREAKARLSEAAAAARRGERVIVTQDGKPYVEFVLPRIAPKSAEVRGQVAGIVENA